MDLETINDMDKMLFDAKQEYERKTSCKWLCVGLFFLIGLILGNIIPTTIQLFTQSKYKRANLEKLMQEELG